MTWEILFILLVKINTGSLKVYVTLFISLGEQSLLGFMSRPEHCEVGQTAEYKDGFAQRGRPRQCLRSTQWAGPLSRRQVHGMMSCHCRLLKLSWTALTVVVTSVEVPSLKTGFNYGGEMLCLGDDHAMGVSWRTTSLEIDPSYGYVGHRTHGRQQNFRSGRTLPCAGCCSHLHEELKIPSIGAGFDYGGQPIV